MSQEIIPVEVKAWLVLSFGEDRQHGGNVGYGDDPETVYRYDSYVPNHKRLSPNDLLVIAGRTGLIGFARIIKIQKHHGHKKFFRCPECRTSAIKKRKRARVLFRCNHGHEFEVPVTEDVECMEYEAHFEGNFVRALSDIPMPELRKACPKYSDQLAIQEFDFARIESQAYRAAPELEALLSVTADLTASANRLLNHAEVGREDVLAALRRIDESGVPPAVRGKLYEVVYNGNRYPVKYVLSLAMRQAARKGDSSQGSRGGETLAGHVLRRLGFAVERIGGTAEIIEDLM
jgi:hypothetical protein